MLKQPVGWSVLPMDGTAANSRDGQVDGSCERGKMGELHKELRRSRALEAAWRVVRRNGLGPNTSLRTKAEVLEFEENAARNLKSIQSRLVKGTFQFAPQKGVAIPRPGKKSRPIVIAPVENRIVQRALLNEMTRRIDAVRDVLNIETSVGGIEGRETAIAIAWREIKNGAKWFVRSDIPDFFTKIPKKPIADFLRAHCDDLEFVALYEQAIETVLGNEADLGQESKLFPSAEVGVAQGSALSPLAGNILLRDFDKKMNGRGIVCVRYIDDFLILGPSREKVAAAFNSARASLEKFGLGAYDPATHPNKAAIGPIDDGFDFLGCHIVPGLIQPSSDARSALLGKVREILNDSARAVKDALRGKGTAATERRRFAQTLEHLDNRLNGWRHAYQFCNGVQSIESLDAEIDKLLRRYLTSINSLLDSESFPAWRRGLGVAVLADVPRVDINQIKRNLKN